MISATQYSVKFRFFLRACLSITQRRQRRRLLIWDPQTLVPNDPGAAQEKAAAH